MTHSTYEVLEFTDEFLTDEVNQAVIDIGWDDLLRAEIDEYADNYFDHVDDELFEKLVETVILRHKMEAQT